MSARELELATEVLRLATRIVSGRREHGLLRQMQGHAEELRSIIKLPNSSAPVNAARLAYAQALDVMRRHLSVLQYLDTPIARGDAGLNYPVLFFTDGGVERQADCFLKLAASTMKTFNVDVPDTLFDVDAFVRSSVEEQVRIRVTIVDKLREPLLAAGYTPAHEWE